MTSERTIWNDYQLDLPTSWELLRYSRKPGEGVLGWADRYAFRLEMSWHTVPGVPDFKNMIRDYRANLEEEAGDDEAELVLRERRKDDWHGLVAKRNGNSARYGRYFADREQLVELVFLWPDSRRSDIEDQILGSFRDLRDGRDAKEPVLWQAFGLRAQVPAGLTFSTCQVQPAQAIWTFDDGDKAKRVWHFERLGLLEHWLPHGDIDDWLHGKNPIDLLDISEDHQTVDGHEIYWVGGHVAALKWPKVGKRVNRYDAAAWVCPKDGRLYHASRISPTKDDQKRKLVGEDLRCCDACPSIAPKLRRQTEERSA